MATEGAAEPRPQPGLAEGGALALREPGRALDLRRRPAALRPARRQPRVLRGPRLLGLRHHLLLGPAGAAAAARCCWRSSCCCARSAAAFFKGAHLVFIAALVALIAAQALKKSIDASDGVLIGLSVAIGVALAALYARAEPLRSFLNILTPAPLVFLLLFLLGLAGVEARLPRRGRARAPSAASRRRRSWWCCSTSFRRTRWSTSRTGSTRRATRASPSWRATRPGSRTRSPIYDSTERAQPAIMDGDLPAKDRLPISADHPNSIFSLFAKTHRLNVSEEATSVCSRDLCEDTRARRAVRRPHLVDERGPRAGVAPRGVAARDRGGPRLRLRELGRLRRLAAARGSGNSSSDSNKTAHPVQPGRRAPGPLRGVGRPTSSPGSGRA